MPLSTGLLTEKEKSFIIGYPRDGLYVLAVVGDEIKGGERAHGPNDYMEQAMTLPRYYADAGTEIYRGEIVGGILTNIAPAFSVA